MSQTKAQLLDGSVVSVSFGAGSAAAPSIYYSADSTTGIYFPGSGQLAISTSGTQRVFVASGGLVGLGTNSWNLNSVSTKLGVKLSGTTGDGVSLLSLQNTANQYVAVGAQYDNSNTNNGSQIRFGIDSIGDTFSMIALATANGSTPVERVRIDRLGNVGIGTTAPATALQVIGTGAFGNGVGGRLQVTTDSNLGYLDSLNNAGTAFQPLVQRATEIQFHTNTSGTTPTQKAVIDSSGRVGIGTTSPSSNGLVTIYETTNARLFLTDSTLGSGYGAQIRGFGVGGSGGNLSLGVIDNNVYNEAVQVLNQSTSVIFKINNGSNGSTTERARIDSSGRLLVGTSTSIGYNGLLQVVGGDTARPQIHRNINDQYPPVLYLSKARGTGAQAVSSGDSVGNISFVGNDGTGQVPLAYIDGIVDGTVATNSMPGRLVFSTTASGSASPTERMRIRSDGRVNIPDSAPAVGILNVKGVDTAQIGFQPSGTASFYHQMGSWNTGTGNFAIVHSSGTGVQLIGSGANTWSTFSDVRLKDVIGGVEAAIEAVKTLEPIRFTWKSDDDKKPCVGISAQSIQAVLPEAVDESPLFADAEKEDADREIYLTVRYTDVIPLLTAALQEAIGRIETLEAKVAALKGV